MKKIMCVALAVLLTINLCACFGLLDDDSNTSSYKYEFVEQVQMSVDYSSYLGYSAEVTGKIKNISNKEFSYISVTFAIYDEDGNQIDTALDNMNYLQAGSTWAFRAITFTYSDVRPRSCKLVDVSFW